MLESVSEHQFWAAVAIYWIFSAAVSSIIKASPWRARASRPDPQTVRSPGYLWRYRFLHSIAGNVTTAFAGKIPGLKTFLAVRRRPSIWIKSQGTYPIWPERFGHSKRRRNESSTHVRNCEARVVYCGHSP